MKSGWLSSSGDEFKVFCTRDLEPGSDDFRLFHDWADHSKVLPKHGGTYRVSVAYGLRLEVNAGKTSLVTVFTGVITTSDCCDRERLVIFDSIDKFNRYFIIQEV